MPERSPPSDLVEIARRNGDFQRNYGTLVGAFLYLRSLSAVRRGGFYWAGLISVLVSAVLPWIGKLRWLWP